MFREFPKRNDDYVRLTPYQLADDDWYYSELNRRFPANRRRTRTPRRRLMYWKGNRRSGFHQYHKWLMKRQVRRYNEDTFWEDGLSLPPYTRKCVDRMDD